MTDTKQLYESLNTDDTTKDITTKHKTYIIDSVKKMGVNEMQIIYNLIQYRADIVSNNACFGVVITSDGDMSWDLNNLDTQLRRIILLFSQLEMKRLVEIRN
jgi:hypothetical protein